MKKYKITVDGCDGYTEVTMNLSETEYKLIAELSELINETSTYVCMPRMQIAEAEEEA